METGRWICALGLSLALSGCALLEAQRQAVPTAAERGRELSVRLCAACHAVEPGGVSPRPGAAPFASREMQHMAGLEGRVAALTRQGHYGMPPIALSAQQADDIVTYIGSLGGREAGSSGGSLAPSRGPGPRGGAAAAAEQADEPRTAPAPTSALGRALVVRSCALRHAVGRSDASPKSGAPALQDLSRRYEVEALGEVLAEGILTLTGHPEMPEFRSPHEVDAILRDLQSLQARQRGAQP